MCLYNQINLTLHAKFLYIIFDNFNSLNHYCHDHGHISYIDWTAGVNMYVNLVYLTILGNSLLFAKPHEQFIPTLIYVSIFHKWAFIWIVVMILYLLFTDTGKVWECGEVVSWNKSQHSCDSLHWGLWEDPLQQQAHHQGQRLQVPDAMAGHRSPYQHWQQVAHKEEDVDSSFPFQVMTLIF